jgi:hypothetical protein
LVGEEGKKDTKVLFQCKGLEDSGSSENEKAGQEAKGDTSEADLTSGRTNQKASRISNTVPTCMLFFGLCLFIYFGY